LELRPYQRECVDAIYAYLRSREGNPVAVLPTAAGKSVLIARICGDAVGLWNGRICVLSHVKELLEQTADKLRRLAPEVPIGFYSAGLGRRDVNHPVIVAGIQSVYRRACELGPFDLVLVDEVHLVGESDEGMFRQFLAEARVVNPHLRVIGLTATPFRLKSGPICGVERIFSEICYEVGVRELIAQGYLCPLRSKAGTARADTSALHVRGGEFVADEVETLMDDDALVRQACAEIVRETETRQAVLIFAAGVRHGLHVVEALRRDHGLECGFVCGTTPAAERDQIIARFRGEAGKDLFAERRPLKYLCNVNVLTTGFDAPNIDCVALLRPTNSPGLYYQMVGRGFRLHPGKQDCLVLDFGGNILRHGPVDALKLKDKEAGGGEAPAKECPTCHAVIHAAYAKCPECGHEFPPPEREKHDRQAATEGILSGEVTTTEHEVIDVVYRVHQKRGADEGHPRTMRVDYYADLNTFFSEWVCFEHTGFARNKAEKWWRERSNEPLPESAEDAVAMARAGALCETLAVTVRHVAGEKYDRIINYRLGDKPSRLPEPEYVAADDDIIPF